MATYQSIKRKRGTVYKAIIRRAGQKTLTRTFSTISDAKKWARQRETDLERESAGFVHEGHRKTLHQTIKKYREEKLPELRPNTIVKYEKYLDYWDKKLGKYRLTDISPTLIGNSRDELAYSSNPPKSPATVNRYLATLASVLTVAVKRWHWLPSSPMQAVDKLSENNARTRFLSDDELHRLLSVCKASESPNLYVAVLLAITTGMRQGELLGLRWEDIDLNKGLIFLSKTKNDDPRALPIVNEVQPLLKARREAGGAIQLNGLVFPSTVSKNQPIDLRRSWKTALRNAGIENFRWHDLRHTAASLLAMNGASLREIGEVLGHRSQATSKRYAHLTQEHTHNLVHQTMGKALSTKLTNE